MSNFVIVNAEQRSPEWFAARAGLVTGSCANKVLAEGRKKGEESTTRRDYRYQLAAERLSGQPAESVFINDAMKCGIEQEPFARMAYEGASGNDVRQTGFLVHREIAAGCSLDGDIEDFTGLVEVKCPKTVTHIGYLEDDRVPPAYVPQITHQMLITGAEWTDFVSYDPRLPEDIQLFIKRVTRADLKIDEYRTALLAFIAEVDALETKLRNMRKKQ